MRTDRINRRGLLKMMMGTSAAVMFSGTSAVTNAMGRKSDTEIAFLSDNYFDMCPRESKTVILETPKPLKESDIRIRTWLDEREE
jgi:hypothetical protein